ncbi:PilZ domain-containing protein [uncultured Sphingomonas sp.]|uniref:PilZ domain-containing protein n=1 Tax=uncultured Sphingomonas sp. TaxID=158754 RepID=UPI0025D86490|nr:PilZ domain-containing protein [uncultured Sphingomonas sp.]
MDAMNRMPGNGAKMAEEELERADRTGQRDSLLMMAQMTLEGENSPREVRVRNISEGGLMAELPVSVEINSSVQLDLRGVGPITGRIAWCTQGRVGVAFDRQIDPKLARKPVGGGTSTPEYAKAATTPKTRPFNH